MIHMLKFMDKNKNIIRFLNNNTYVLLVFIKYFWWVDSDESDTKVYIKISFEDWILFIINL